MADAVTSQTLVDGPRDLVMKFTNLSDGTGESAVKKVDVASGTTLKLMRVAYSVNGMVASLFWDADTDVKILDLAGDGDHDFRSFGGIPNNAGTGVTGDVMLTTTGHTSGDSYWIILEFQKT
jgi:hypothetical protein